MSVSPESRCTLQAITPADDATHDKKVLALLKHTPDRPAAAQHSNDASRPVEPVGVRIPNEPPAWRLKVKRNIVLVLYYFAGSSGGGVLTMFATKGAKWETNGRVRHWRSNQLKKGAEICGFGRPCRKSLLW